MPLAQALRSNRGLQRLNLWGSKIDPRTDGGALREALQVNVRLLDLEVRESMRKALEDLLARNRGYEPLRRDVAWVLRRFSG